MDAFFGEQRLEATEPARERVGGIRAGERGRHRVDHRAPFTFGDATLEAVKGFEYVPVKQQVLLSPNQTTVVTLRLKRWTDLPSLGWHSGDVHMHPNHVEGGVYMTLEDCRLYALERVPFLTAVTRHPTAAAHAEAVVRHRTPVLTGEVYDRVRDDE